MKKIATPVTLNKARFTVYSDGCVRMEYAWQGKFSPYPSLLVGRNAAQPIRAEAEITKTSVLIRTPRFELEYKENGEVFSPENLRIRHKDALHRPITWTPGKRDHGNLGTVTRSLDFWTHCGGPERYPHEGILSTEGGHFLPDESRVYWNTTHDWPENYANHVGFDGYFFAYANDYKAALRDFISVFGRIPMVPRWSFGFWYSRWHAYHDHEFIQLVKEYRSRNIPIDVMVIDTDWRKGWGGYDWSGKYFPNAKKTMRELHRLGVKTTLNDHPGYDNYDSLPDDDSHIPEIERRLGALPHQGQWSCDWSRKEAVKTWKDVLLGPLFDDGMDFWWVDGWIKPPFAVTPLGGILQGGIDSQLWANLHYYELAEEKTGKRGMILSRWGGIGAHRYPVQFSGDTPSEWQMLQHQVEFTSRSGGLGAVYWSHDIGGFFANKPDEELYIRWIQFGTFSPVFRTHSAHGIREPWNFSEQLTENFRRYTRIRCALAPYWYTLAHEAHETGLPLCRPMYLEHPGGPASGLDGGSLNQRRQYLVGRDLLVAPADTPADKATKCARKRVYFPWGQWHELEGHETIEGMHDRSLRIPIDRLPVYVRAGAIIPCQPVGEHVGSAPPSAIEFDYWPDSHKPSEFALYEDDGETREYEKKRFAVTVIKGLRTDHAIEMIVEAPKGRYRGMPAKRAVTLLAMLEPGEEADFVSVTVGKSPAKRVKHAIGDRCLAGEATTGHRFCRITVTSRNERIVARIALK